MRERVQHMALLDGINLSTEYWRVGNPLSREVSNVSVLAFRCGRVVVNPFPPSGREVDLSEIPAM
jgi:hypothetical protein